MNITIARLFEIPEFVRAVTAAPLIAAAAALLGVFLILGNKSMMCDGLSHVGLGAAAFGLAVGIAPLPLALAAVAVSSLILLLPARAERSAKGSDAVIGALSGGILAVGIMAVSICRGVNSDIDGFLFGSLLTLSTVETVICSVVSLAVILFFVFASKQVFALTFSPDFSASSGVDIRRTRTIVSVLVSAVTVISMKAVGALLITALAVFPVLSAMKLCRSFRATLICSAAVAAFGALVGFGVSLALSLPTGACIVAVGILIYILCSLFCSVVRSRSDAQL